MNALFSLLTFRAFLPDILDVEEPLGSRFKKHKYQRLLLTQNRVIVVSAGRSSWRAAVAEFDGAGNATFSASHQSPPIANREAVTEWLRDFAKAHKLKNVAIGIGYGFAVTSLNAVPRMSDVDTMRALRSDPTRLLGDNAGTEEVNAFVHHPQVENSCLHFKIRSTELNIIREVCGTAGLQIVRVVCEQAQLLQLAYSGSLTEKSDVLGLLIAQPSSLLFVPLERSGWPRPTYDPALDEHAAEVLIQAANDSIPQGGKLAYLDAGMNGFGDLLHSLSNFTPESLADSEINPAFAAIAHN